VIFLPKKQPKEPFHHQKFHDPDYNSPSVLWNALVYPFLPMRLQGIIWYQGENNEMLGNQSSYEYSCQFQALITDWRDKWGYSNQPNAFYFIFVQLAAYTEYTTDLISLPIIRLSQMSVLNLNNVGMATAIDLGDPSSPYGNIHPQDKLTVGERLTLVAQALIYGNSSKVSVNSVMGPKISSSSFTIMNSKEIKIIVEFQEETINNNLVLKSAICPQSVGNVNCESFGILTQDGIWNSMSINAQNISIENQNTISFIVPYWYVNLSAVRYAFANWPLCLIFDDFGLPALPFVYYFNQ